AFLELSSTFWSCSLVVFWQIYQREAPKRQRALFASWNCSPAVPFERFETVLW
ncbi:28434_t:CDS:1, partial [Gigaspora margarita]